MLTTVARFRDPWEAEMLCGLLDSEGIPAMTAFDRHIWVNWPISNALGGVRVQVASQEYEAALRVWNDVQAGHYEADLEQRHGPFDRNRCPDCGSDDVACRPSIAIIVMAIVLAFFTSAIFPPRKMVCRCRRCRHVWDVDRPK